VRFLETVLDAIRGWPFDWVDVALVTNDLLLGEVPTVQSLRAKYQSKGWTLRIEHASDLAHPFHLTWWHKRHLRPWLEKARTGRDYFIYLEDDIVLTRENIAYFLDARPRLATRGLIPGFLRFENIEGIRHSVDFVQAQPVNRRSTLRVDGQRYIVPLNPYWAGFVLDRALAEEYVATPSFQLEPSATRTHWEVRERAAMGLTWENVPPRARSRYAVPIDACAPAAGCLVWHCAQNYSSDAATPFARLPLDTMFARDNLRWYLRRGVSKARRILSL
jgi:hypothetical protein